MKASLRGGIKNCFFHFLSKRGGGRLIQKIFIRKYLDFFYQFYHFWPITQKLHQFLTNFFSQSGEGVLPNPKNPYQKKLRWSKKGEEGGSQFFFTKSKKWQFFYAAPNCLLPKQQQPTINKLTLGCEQKIPIWNNVKLMPTCLLKLNIIVNISNNINNFWAGIFLGSPKEDQERQSKYLSSFIRPKEVE